MVGEGHGDESDASDQITNVEEEEAPQKRIRCSENLSRLLGGPDGPEGRAEIPDGLHGPCHLPASLCSLVDDCKMATECCSVLTA